MQSQILLLVFVLLFLYRVEVATLVLRPSRSIDRSINRSVVIKAPYVLTTKSDLELLSPVTSSDEVITILRGYYCKYQLAERPVRQGIICQTSGKRASQTSKQKHNRAKHFGWHWLLKPLKKPLFQKQRWSCDSPPRNTPVAQKDRTISRQEKMAFSTPPPSGCLSTPLPLPQSLCGRTDVRTYVRTDGHVTITLQPKFLGSIGYQICLALELRWWALPAGSLY